RQRVELTKVAAQRGDVPAARGVDRPVGRCRETGYPHPQERLGLQLLRPAGPERGTAHDLPLGDDRVGGVAYLAAGLPGERRILSAPGQDSQPHELLLAARSTVVQVIGESHEVSVPP